MGPGMSAHAHPLLPVAAQPWLGTLGSLMCADTQLPPSADHNVQITTKLLVTCTPRQDEVSLKSHMTSKLKARINAEDC